MINFSYFTFSLCRITAEKKLNATNDILKRDATTLGSKTNLENNGTYHIGDVILRIAFETLLA